MKWTHSPKFVLDQNNAIPEGKKEKDDASKTLSASVLLGLILVILIWLWIII